MKTRSGRLVCSSRSEPGRALLAALAVWLVGAAGGPLVLTAMSGDEISVTLAPAERGIVLHFWATWCPTCAEELAVLDAASRRCPAAAARVAAVNVGEDVEVVADYARRHGLELEMLRDPRGAVWRELSGAGLPINLIWTPAGRRVEIGPRTAGEWAEALASLGCHRAE